MVRETMFLAGLRYMVLDTANGGTEVYGFGTWPEIAPVRVAGYLRWLGRWGLTSYVSILAAYLVGLWAIRSGYLHRVITEPRVTRRLLAVSLAAAAVGYASWLWADALWPPVRPPENVVPVFPYPLFQLAMLRQVVLRFFDWATVGPAVAYGCLLLLAWQRPLGERVLRPLAATGQMALTTYLTQSIVCTLLFYGYGLGWFGKVGFTGMLLITLSLFSLQMVASTWWLGRYRYGPAEWVWRWLAYGRPPRMRLAPG